MFRNLTGMSVSLRLIALPNLGSGCSSEAVGRASAWAGQPLVEWLLFQGMWLYMGGRLRDVFAKINKERFSEFSILENMYSQT